jgi:hypothetical protein
MAGGLPGLTLTQLARLRVPRAVIWGANDTVDSLASGRTTAAALPTRLQTIPRQVTSQCWLNPKRPSAAFSTSSLALPTQSATGATRPARRRTWQGVDVPVLIALHEDVDRTRGNEQNGNEREHGFGCH